MLKGLKDAFSYAGVKMEKSVLDKIGEKPDAFEATGALRPISTETYNSLSDEDKKKYTAPTWGEVYSYSVEAKRFLLMKSIRKQIPGKKLLWALFDGNPSDKKTVGRVIEVTDGDTFKMKVGNETKTVRLLLVDTPETVDPDKAVMVGGKDASRYSQDSLFNKDVKVYFDNKEG